MESKAMAIYPVIMCGGAGTRLWPASRPEHPKQFLPLIAERSLFQTTVRRVVPLALQGGGELIIVAGIGHLDQVREQLAAEGVQATLLIEPSARDSGPAMASAAAWIHRRDPEGIAVFVASDHHIPDGEAFRSAVLTAAEAAGEQQIVTLGVRPLAASSAYGYIHPAEEPSSGEVRSVVSFVEKPDPTQAQAYVERGYLWNSGNFIARADVFLSEVRLHVPEMEAAVSAALDAARQEQNVVYMGSAFNGAVKLSIDYAVMEPTRLASVLPVSFAWSDLGAWDAVYAATDSPDAGRVVRVNAEGGLVRAAPGMSVAVIGVENLAVIAQNDAVLVCHLDAAQDVKRAVDQFKALGSERVAASFRDSLADRTRAFGEWLKLRALPLWTTLGLSEDGAFYDVMSSSAQPLTVPRRARVQPRQAYVMARAGALGWGGPWQFAAERAMDRFRQAHGRSDGLYHTLLEPDGTPLDETAKVYDQAFVILAECALGRFDQAEVALKALSPRALAEGYKEAGEHPYQANAHMHLFEAALAGAEGSGGDWGRLTDDLAEMAVRRFFQPDTGAIREYFDEAWNPIEEGSDALVEPGHQFEWAWLLERYAHMRNRPDISEIARRLYATGCAGIDAERDVAVDKISPTLAQATRSARLWPQTERLKAALLLAESATGDEQEALLSGAERALRGVQRYLDETGLWRDQMGDDGTIKDDPAPASTFYHLIAAFEQLASTGRKLNLTGLEDLDLR